MNFWKHWNKVRTHRKWVRHYCWGMGLYWQGLTHDLSKYSPTEFMEGARFYQGTSSPIDAAKKAKGYSDAWFHHKGRNKHHYEYWMDNFDLGGENIVMPYKYFAEMVCDYLAAGRAYMGKNFSYTAEYEWWQNKRRMTAMNPRMVTALDIIFWDLMKAETEGHYTAKSLLTDKSYIHAVYSANCANTTWGRAMLD